MSEPLRVALVAEGPTDRIVLDAALRAMLDQRPFILKQLHPEGSSVFNELGTGWVGVYRWCKQSARRGGGRLSSDRLVFNSYDILILHLDADVAGFQYEDGQIQPEPSDRQLPCELPCPPAADTTDVLRLVLLSWFGEDEAPANVVICTPSKNTETWVVKALFPNDKAMRKNIECFPDPESRLGQQPKQKRIRKSQRHYQDHSEDLRRAWPQLLVLTEAVRFQRELLGALARLK